LRTPGTPLDDQDDVLALAEDVHRRIAAAAARARLQPIAGAKLVEGVLELEQRFERI
jgi:hypothetical protein